MIPFSYVVSSSACMRCLVTPSQPKDHFLSERGRAMPGETSLDARGLLHRMQSLTMQSSGQCYFKLSRQPRNVLASLCITSRAG
jgi:hypothetical protein